MPGVPSGSFPEPSTLDGSSGPIMRLPSYAGRAFQRVLLKMTPPPLRLRGRVRRALKMRSLMSKFSGRFVSSGDTARPTKPECARPSNQLARAARAATETLCLREIKTLLATSSKRPRRSPSRGKRPDHPGARKRRFFSAGDPRPLNVKIKGSSGPRMVGTHVASFQGTRALRANG